MTIMFDYDAISTEALARIGTAIDRCRNGSYGLERGAKARHLLVEEAEEQTRRTIRDAFKFDSAELPTYLATIPNLLDTFVDDAGDLGDLIAEAVKTRLYLSIMPDVLNLLYDQRRGEDFEDMLDDLETTLRDDLDPIPQFHGGRLHRLILDCREEASVETLVPLASALRLEAEGLRKLAHSLDIADPPTAAYAVRGVRRLLEAASLCRLNHELDLIEDFCTGRSGASSTTGGSP